MRPVLFALTLMVFAAYAIDCSGSIEMGLPAVNEGDAAPSGDMVIAKMHLVEGTGRAYLSVDPNSDSMLQQSIQSANQVGRREAGAGAQGNCDLLVGFEGEDGGLVSGPSGGAAFSLMAYSLLSGNALRNDTAITGAVMPDGTIIPVGGLYEKALSTKKAGRKYLLTPFQTIDEQLMLSKIKGLQIYEVGNVGEAADFFVDGVVPEQKKMNLTPEPLPELQEYSGEDIPAFGNITSEMIQDEEGASADIGDAEVKKYFEERIAQQEELLSKKYYYSAANDAFLGYVLADSLANIDNPDVEAKMAQVNSCIEQGKPVEPTYENYEWVMGADARMKRAENELAKFDNYEIGTKEENYYAIYELDYALAWCQAGSRMYAEAGEIGGTPIGQLSLKEMVDEYIAISKNYTGIEDSENYQNGLDLYEEGRYAGALHEIVYALSFERRDYAEKKGELNGEEVLKINAGERKTMWGRIFQAHTQYLLASNDTSGAYATAVFSAGMEGVGGELATRRLSGEMGFAQENGTIVVIGNESAKLNGTGAQGNETAPSENGGGNCPPPPLCSIGMVLLAIPLFPLFIKDLAHKRKAEV